MSKYLKNKNLPATFYSLKKCYSVYCQMSAKDVEFKFNISHACNILADQDS